MLLHLVEWLSVTSCPNPSQPLPRSPSLSIFQQATEERLILPLGGSSSTLAFLSDQNYLKNS